MSYRTTTSYGTWCNRVAPYSTSPDADLADYIGGADSDWLERVEKSGALKEMESAFRDAIEAALPDSISLCGDEFIGPYEPEDGEFDGCPVDEHGGLDFKAMFEDITLESIVDYYEPVTLEEIGRWQMKSKAANPAKAASMAMSRAGLKPYTYLPHPESGRPQAIYLKGVVRKALNDRPGRGKRTDLKDAE